LDLRNKLSGLYFVVDPGGKGAAATLDSALLGGVDAVEVWANWKDRREFVRLVKEMRELTNSYTAPLIINNDLEMARIVDADGLHLDDYEITPSAVRSALGPQSYVGYTTGNDLSRVIWADDRGADYISFCSVFPSSSVGECEIVPLEVVRKSRGLTNLSIFASGGITPLNAGIVMDAGVDGIAVVSAIQRASDPRSVAEQFKRIISLARESRLPVGPG